MFPASAVSILGVTLMFEELYTEAIRWYNPLWSIMLMLMMLWDGRDRRCGGHGFSRFRTESGE